MKTLITVVIFCMCLIATAETKSSVQKSVLESVLEEMTKQYLETAVKDAAMTAIEEYATEALATDLSGTMSSGLAAIGLVDNLNSYGKASSETERYQAISHGLVNVVTMVNPAIGGLVQLGVFAQDLSAAFVSREYSLRQAQLIAEITQIDRQRSKLVLVEFQAEERELRFLFARASSALALGKEVLRATQQACSEEYSRILNPKECMQKAFLYQKILHA